MARPISGESAFRALAHPIRRTILLALRNGERAAGDLMPAPSPIARTTLSRHLRALQQAGLVSLRGRGPRLMYRINENGLRPIEQFLVSMRRALPPRRV